MASNVAKANRFPVNVANGRQTDSPAVECPRKGRQVGAAQSCGCGGTRRLDGSRSIGGWRQLVTVQACRRGGRGRRAQVRKGAERSYGKAVGVARRGEAGQGNVPRARPVESRTGALGEWIERHWLWLAWRIVCLVHRVGGGPLRRQQKNNNNKRRRGRSVAHAGRTLGNKSTRTLLGRCSHVPHRT